MIFRWADFLSIFLLIIYMAGISPSSGLFLPLIYEFTSAVSAGLCKHDIYVKSMIPTSGDFHTLSGGFFYVLLRYTVHTFKCTMMFSKFAELCNTVQFWNTFITPPQSPVPFSPTARTPLVSSLYCLFWIFHINAVTEYVGFSLTQCEVLGSSTL